MFKKLIPSFLKHIYWKLFLFIRYSKSNKIASGVSFSKDLIIGRKCIIGNRVIFGRGVELDNNVKIGASAFLENIKIGQFSTVENIICGGYGNGKIKIGKECYIGLYNTLDWSNNITIGDYVHIAGPSTGLWTHTSAPMCLNSIKLSDKSEKYRPTTPIVIESNVYIGGNCTIYPGITIGHHSIIAPNSAVTKDVPPYTLAGGVPAREIKKTNNYIL